MNNTKPRVILSAGNINQYHHTALALQNAGLLKRYISTFLGNETSRHIWSLLPAKWRNRLHSKNVPALDKNLVITFPIPYIFSQLLRRMGLISYGYANSLFSQWYDKASISWIDDSEIFHFVDSLGLWSARKAKKKGTIIICDVRAAYVDELESVLVKEYEELGLDYSSPMKQIRDRLVREYNLANYIFLPSNYAAHTFEQAGFSRQRLFVVPYGVDLGRFTSQRSAKMVEERESSVFRIIYVGRVNPSKGIHYLLQAFMSLDLPNSELLIIGNVNDKAYTERWLSVEDPRVHLKGSVPQMDLWRYYRQSSVIVLPSLSDSWGLVVTEAMAMGLPVIVSENTGAKEIINNGVEGFIVPIRDVEALQEKLLWLYEHPDESREMGKLARQRVQEFTWEKYGERLLEVYDAILQRENLL